jgi:hypothetical protein
MRGLRRSRSWQMRRMRRSRRWLMRRMRSRSWMRKLEQEGLSAPCSCWRGNRRSPVNNDKHQLKLSKKKDQYIHHSVQKHIYSSYGVIHLYFRTPPQR